MKTYYEIINSFFKSLYTVSEIAPKNTQIKLLRSRYYLNLTYLDSIAKFYGEMGGMSQFSLYIIASVLTTTGFFLLNPGLLFIGGLTLQFLLLISSQYKAMECRFSQMVYDLEESEKQLNGALKVHRDLAQEINIGTENNQKLINRLGQVGIEIAQIRERVILKEQLVSLNCDVIDDSVKQSQEVIERLLSSTLKIEEKERELIATLAEVCDVVKSSSEKLDGIANSFWEVELGKKKAYRENIELFLSENFSSILNVEDDNIQETVSLNSFFNQKSSELIVDIAGINIPAI